METIAPLNFSLVIAYLLPGFVSLYSLTYFSVRIKILFDSITSKDCSLGIPFIILLASLACGVIISAIRGLFLDGLQKKTGIVERKFDYSKLKDDGIRKAFNDSISNTWRYTQSYGNMFLSLFLLYASKVLSYENIIGKQWLMIVALAITIVLLFFCHRDSLKNTYQTIGDILK